MVTHRVDRIGPGDLVELATDVGPVPMNVGALLLLDGPTTTDPATVEAVLTERLMAVPRLRQRLVSPPAGLGRPYWLDVPGFDVDHHLERVRCPAPGDREALLTVATEAVTRPLPRSRPLWRAVVVTGPTGGASARVALVIVLHHVLADGIGGLALLGRLVDGIASTTAAPPVPAVPRARDLLVDNLARRLAALRRLPGSLTAVRRGRQELGHRAVGGQWATRCSLNAPTGPKRAIAVVEADLAPLLVAARRAGATLNDVLLVTVVGAMGQLLRRRGERVSDLVVSVPVSARGSTTGDDLGNQVGVMPVRVPLDGPVPDRLARVAASSRAQKTQARGASAALVGPAFRLLAAVGLFRWFVDRQHLVNSFLTNLRGPTAPLTLAGAEITRIVPVTVTAGNVGVAFAALSYAGRLSVTIIADPDVVPETAALRTALESELSAVACSADP